MTTEEAINEIIKNEELDTNQISDGYHTFAELYDHRITLFVALCNTMQFWVKREGGKGHCWKSKLHSDGTMFDGWFVAGTGKTKGEQITYHLPIDRWDELKVEELDKAPEWDGHTPADVLERIKNYLY